MSDVNPNDTKIITTAGDVLPLYTGAGPQAKAGLEVELSFLNAGRADLAPMSLPQNKVVKHAANAALPDGTGLDWVRNEPTTDTLEAASIAAAPGDLQAIMDDANRKIRTLMQKAQAIGLKRSYFAELPEQSAGQLLSSLVDVPRYQAFFNPPRADMMAIAAYFAVCKSNQVSISYRDPAHMLQGMRRLYALAPFLFLLTENSSGFDEGKKFSGHAGMRHRAALGPRGGVASYVFEARDGHDLIARHIEAVMNNPLYTYYDHQGNFVKLPSGEWTSFEDLRARGLNTATNYFFAQTVLWPDVKIAAIKDAQGEVTGHRYEARMFGVGVHQHQTALLIVAGLAFNEDFAARTDMLLRAYGFDMADPARALEVIRQSYDAAMNHGGRFMDIAYGSGRMTEFARAFADLLERAYTGSAFEEAIAPALSIARSGCTDGKVNRLLFPTLEDALRQQQNYDPAIFYNPAQCARQIYEGEVAFQSRGAPCVVART